MKHEQLTVGQLIALLAPLNPDMPVQTEGCDCVGQAKGISFDDVQDEVTITKL